MLYCPRLTGADDESRTAHIDEEIDGSHACHQTTGEARHHRREKACTGGDICRACRIARRSIARRRRL
mgnify:CR=1 FL=1